MTSIQQNRETTSINSTRAPQMLDEEFKRRARVPNGAAAMAMLARGHPVVYRENDTPAGHIIRRHPNGRTEVVKIDLTIPEKSITR